MADVPGPCLHLADLLAEEAFGLDLLCGGPGAGQRRIRGAHAVEVDAPVRWIDADWILLTTGVRLRGNVEAQRALVLELEAGRACALGFGVGLGFKRVPPALVDVARDRGFPVFAVPYETPFREIIHFVDSSLTSGEEYVFRRLTALQRYLVDALRTEEPERAMVERLSRFLDASVLVVGPDGTPEIVAGRRPADGLAAGVCGRSPGLHELDAGGWHAVAAPLGTRPDGDGRWLVLASPRRAFAGRLAKPAAEATAPLLAALGRLTDVVRDQEQALKAALLEEALEPPRTRDLLPVAARVAAFGLDFSRQARLAVAREHPLRASADGNGAGTTRRGIVAALERSRLPHLTDQRGDSCVVLVQGDEDELRPALEAVCDARPELAVGVGRAVTTLADAHHSLRDAELALARACLDPDRRIMYFDEFDLGTFIVSEIPSERLAPKVDEIASLLRANPAIHEALQAYFAHHLDIAAAAASLYMHRNSLRYRLARAEQLLGRSLKDPSAIAAVYIALVAEQADRGLCRVTNPLG